MTKLITLFFFLLSFCSFAQVGENDIKFLKDKILQYEKSGDSLSVDYMISIDDFGEYYFNNNDYSKAEKLFIKSLELKKRILGQKHIEYAYSLHNLGSLYGQKGRYEEAEALILEALQIRSNILGKKNKLYLYSLENLAKIYAIQGKYSQAEPLFLEVIELKKSTFGLKSLEYMNSLKSVAFFYQSQGNFYQAEPLYLKLIDLKKEIFGEKHYEYAEALNDLGMLYYYQERYSKAEPLYLKAIEIEVEALGVKHPNYISLTNNLATLYQAQNKYQEAETLYLKVLEIKKERLGKNKPDNDYAIYLNNLALLYDIEKKYSEAQQLYLETLKIKKEIFGEKNVSYTISLKNLALSYREQGKYMEAEPLLLKSLEIKKEILGEKHPSYILNLLNLAVLYRIIGLNESSSTYFNYFIKANKSRMINDIYTLSEKELVDYINIKKFNVSAPLSFIFDIPNFHSLVNISSFENELILKNLSLRNNERIKQSIQKKGSKSLQEKYQLFISNKRKINKLQELSLDKQPQNLVTLTNETEEIEKELVKESSIFADYKKGMTILFNDIRNKLKKNDISVNLVSFNYYKKILSDSIFYAAFIVKKDSKFPKFISLFEEKQLDFLLTKNKTQQDSTRIGEQYINKAISNLILKPLVKELEGINTIYLSPTGLGHQIDFGALPINESQTLGEKYKLHLLNAPSELVDYKEAKLDLINKPELLLYGGINYGKSDAKEKTENALADLSDEFINNKTRSGIRGFDYIDGTNNEVNQIQQKAIHNGFTTTLLNESTATEESIKALDGRTTPYVLHLATHGFFFADPQEKELPKNILELEGKAKVYKTADDPMMRSGLVFAGVNNYWSKSNENNSIEDGILTASEISNLDLSACQLVVLSACETGLGEVKGSEGVFGLQRAFKMAGVKNIIMSLWKVPDTQTAELFDIFYSECFAGKTIHEAFQSAQSKMKAKYSPYYWAGFVLLE